MAKHRYVRNILESIQEQQKFLAFGLAIHQEFLRMGFWDRVWWGITGRLPDLQQQALARIEAQRQARAYGFRSTQAQPQAPPSAAEPLDPGSLDKETTATPVVDPELARRHETRQFLSRQ